MSKLPEQVTVLTAIENAVVAALGGRPRPHLGASMIGKECERALWYSFHWAITGNKLSGRMLRLFDRGQEEEARFIRWLELAGVTVSAVDPRTGQQYTHADPDCGNHFGGSMDGACIGLPDAPKTWHVQEFKTHSDKSFKDVAKKGVLASKPEHYAQMQVYMHWSQMDRALYMAVNKNDDTLYVERIAYDKDAVLTLLARAKRVITEKEPPAGISERADWYQCKCCDYHAICHGRVDELTGLIGPQALPDVHCRSCLHSTAELTPDSEGKARWSCTRWQADIPVEGQYQGCAEHRYIPALIPWAAVTDAIEVDGVVADVAYELKGESLQAFVNGASSPSPEVPFYSSAELKALHPLLVGDANLQALREQMGATFINVTDDMLVDSFEGDYPL